jgi:cytidylate kinase
MSLLDVQPAVLITGISASGKSTVADLLARRFTRGVHVKGDVFRRMVVAGREEMTSSPSEEALRQLRLRYQLGAATANAYHRAGFAVVVQDVVIGALLNDYVGSIAARPLVVIVLAPTATAVARREAARTKTAYRASDVGIAEWDTAFRTNTPSIGFWVDSSDLTAEQTVDLIVDEALERGQIR